MNHRRRIGLDQVQDAGLAQIKPGAANGEFGPSAGFETETCSYQATILFRWTVRMLT
jgi:hypothetical protein